MLEVSSLFYSYSGQEVFVRSSICAYPGEITVLLGPSGVGKTTLFRLICGFIFPDKGKITWQGHPVSPLNVAYMSQKDSLLPWRTVWKNLLLSTELGDKFSKMKTTDPRLEHVVSSFQLTNLLERYPDEISEGQRQRVSLAIQCLSTKPILLLDEPFSSLDVMTKELLYSDILLLAKREKKTVMLVTHDFRDVAFLGDRFYVIKNRNIIPLEITSSLREADNSSALIAYLKDYFSHDFAHS
ncbi:ABC transporter family protein [Chlamydia ibidis]|uniref:ABC transporter family protein n=2 Tax=Chlamydia ibidis TaxID=1405396 RepID=S7J518_9CHLA|nr:ABC transporter ATP-binding protein [Chlamydia ibidis]EPP35288.1 ABC transporter family protein [Chlamydia ibidis]EQM62747.1 ABC transporter family protein [Chlamydia ibidis 10-1398/6]